MEQQWQVEQQVEQQAQQARQPRVDPTVASFAQQWMSANPWYDPKLGDEDSRVTKAIEISAQVRNLTNDRYEYVWYDGTQRLHAPADPRSVFGAVRARF